MLVLDLRFRVHSGQPVSALKLATCTAQAPQPPSEQASLVPCDKASDCGVDVTEMISSVAARAQSTAQAGTP